MNIFLFLVFSEMLINILSFISLSSKLYFKILVCITFFCLYSLALNLFQNIRPKLSNWFLIFEDLGDFFLLTMFLVMAWINYLKHQNNLNLLYYILLYGSFFYAGSIFCIALSKKRMQSLQGDNLILFTFLWCNMTYNWSYYGQRIELRKWLNLKKEIIKIIEGKSSDNPEGEKKP